MPDLITAAQVAAMKGVLPRQVSRWVAAGRLAYAQKLDGKTGAYLFDPDVVEAFDPGLPAEAASGVTS